MMIIIVFLLCNNNVSLSLFCISLFTSVPYSRINIEEYEVDIYIVYFSDLVIILMIIIQ